MPEQQLVEIARALGADARILIMDEPTASLGEAEVAALFRSSASCATAGVGIIYISHRLEELSAIADRVTVLRDGSTVGTRRDGGRSTATELIRMMVGRELGALFPKRDRAARRRGAGARGTGEPRRRAFATSSLSVRAGEILGLAGLVGAGRTELAAPSSA